MPNPLEEVKGVKVGGHSIVLWIVLGAVAIIGFRYWQARNAPAMSEDTGAADTSGNLTGDVSTNGSLPGDNTNASLPASGVSPVISVTVVPTNSLAGTAGAPKPKSPTALALAFLTNVEHGTGNKAFVHQNAVKATHVVNQHKTVGAAKAFLNAQVAGMQKQLGIMQANDVAYKRAHHGKGNKTLEAKIKAEQAALDSERAQLKLIRGF